MTGASLSCRPFSYLRRGPVVCGLTVRHFPLCNHSLQYDNSAMQTTDQQYLLYTTLGLLIFLGQEVCPHPYAKSAG